MKENNVASQHQNSLQKQITTCQNIQIFCYFKIPSTYYVISDDSSTWYAFPNSNAIVERKFGSSTLYLRPNVTIHGINL